MFWCPSSARNFKSIADAVKCFVQLFRGLALSASVVEAVAPDFKRAPAVAICALFAVDSGQARRFRCQKGKNSGFVPT